MWEERRLRVFENRVLRIMFGPERDEVTREWRKLHNDELNGLYFSPTVIRVIILRRMRWVEHVAHLGRGEVHTGFWWGNLSERDHLEDPGLIYVRILFKIDLQEVGWGSMEWLNLAQDRDRWWALVNVVMNLQVP
jgi:hypothetical protein